MSKQSLVSVPSAIAGIAPVPVVQDTFDRTPYVGFASVKSPKFPDWRVKCPALQDGDPVLFDGDTLTRLTPFRFFLLTALQWWGDVTETGEILEATLDPEKAKTDKNVFKEHGDAVVLVVFPDRLTAARASFHTAKCPALKAAIKGNEDAQSSDWGSRSAEHQMSLASPDPRFRYTTVVSLRPRTSKTGKGAGKPYVQASGVAQPITTPEMLLVTNFFKDPENGKKCGVLNAKHLERVALIRSKCGK